MKINHTALWANNLEMLKDFYVRYFAMHCNQKYVNAQKKFSSYFLSFGDDGARLEIMHRPDIKDHAGDRGLTLGFTHLSISVGSRQKVDELTGMIRKDGYTVMGEPRVTGDGYYESVVLDPEGNYIEITA
jgi:lactoylglutathione lyase